MKHKVLTALAVITILIATASAQEELSKLAIPLCPATSCGKSADGHELASYTGFSLCYRDSYKNAEWVSYIITPEKLIKNARRTNKFREDNGLSAGSAKFSDYKASGYDRGHLAPAADMAWSGKSENESFLMSNIAPQVPQFNRGIWKELEAQVRKYAQELDFLIVATGPVLENPPMEYSAIGESNVRVPEFFYKVLLAKSSAGKWESIGFIMPNQKCEGGILQYKVSVNEVEARTGIDFFSALDDSIEEAVESQTENMFTQIQELKTETEMQESTGLPVPQTLP